MGEGGKTRKKKRKIIILAMASKFPLGKEMSLLGKKKYVVDKAMV